MARSLEVCLEFVLDETAYQSKTFLDVGRKHFHEIGRGVFYCHFPSAADLAQVGPASPLAWRYVPFEEATKIDYFACIPLMLSYDPNHQVVLIAGCVVLPTKEDAIFKGRVISEQSHETIPDVIGADGQVVKGRVIEVERDSVGYVQMTTHCNGCGKKEEKPLHKCANCKAARYCCKKCQVRDWKEHKKTCKMAKEIRQDGKQFLRSGKCNGQSKV